MTYNQIFAVAEKLYGNWRGWTQTQAAVVAELCNAAQA